jgi:hypothetical protein
MRELLHDIALSFCPESVKRVHRPSSPSHVLLAAVLTGPLQTLLFGKWFVSGYLAFLALRGRRLAPAVERMNVTTQGWFVAVLSIEYVVFHPLALLRLYLAAEGFIRLVGGIAVSEVVSASMENGMKWSGKKEELFRGLTSTFLDARPWERS